MFIRSASILFLCLTTLIACNQAPNTQKSLQRFFTEEIQTRYVVGTEDVPLYEGFIEDSNQTAAYDTVEGRIVEAVYSRSASSANMTDIRNFYTVSLPQLGWQKQTSSRYTRDGEQLNYSLTKEENHLILKFTIRPDK